MHVLLIDCTDTKALLKSAIAAAASAETRPDIPVFPWHSLVPFLTLPEKPKTPAEGSTAPPADAVAGGAAGPPPSNTAGASMLDRLLQTASFSISLLRLPLPLTSVDAHVVTSDAHFVCMQKNCRILINQM